jgi:hypothetical protein
MIDTTLIIPAWHRPHYLRRALGSWSAADGVAGLGCVAVALGRGREPDMTSVVSESPLAPAAEIWPDSDRAHQVHGPHTAVGEAIERAFSRPACQFAVVSDEDIVVSDDTLDYFAWARAQDTDMACAHNNLGQAWSPDWDDTGADQAAVRILPEFTGWCWGVTRHAWDRVIAPEWDWDESSGEKSTERGYDWQCHRLAVREQLRVAIPDASRAQNIGQHGGVYAVPSRFAATLAASFRERRGHVGYQLAEESGTHKNSSPERM